MDDRAEALQTPQRGKGMIENGCEDPPQIESKTSSADNDSQAPTIDSGIGIPLESGASDNEIDDEVGRVIVRSRFT